MRFASTEFKPNSALEAHPRRRCHSQHGGRTSKLQFRQPASAKDTLHRSATAVEPLRLPENARALKDAYIKAWGNIVALDVEFAHFALPPEQQGARNRGRRGAPARHLTLVCPGQVCVVDVAGDVVYTSFIGAPPSAAALAHVGGVPKAAVAAAPPPELVASALLRVLDGADVVVGHGLLSDLTALGVTVPAARLRCLRTYPKFQRRGHAMKLRELAAKWLGARIQERVGGHDAEEDALATMALFRHHVMADAAQLQGADLEAHYLFQILTTVPDA